MPGLRHDQPALPDQRQRLRTGSADSLKNRYAQTFANVAGASNRRPIDSIDQSSTVRQYQDGVSRGGTNEDPALHVAVWRDRLETVKLLVARGAPLEATNGRGATPLSLAVRALVEQSDWTPHTNPEIVAVLLDAGACVDTVHPFPSRSSAADALLRERGRAH